MRYLLTAVTAAALGAGTVQLTDLDAYAARAAEHREQVQLTLPNTTLEAVWSAVASATCAQADTQAGFDPGTCAVSPGTVVSLVRGDTETAVSVTYIYAGTFVAGTAQ